MKITGIVFLHIAFIIFCHHASAARLAGEQGVGIDEKLGGYIPSELQFFDESGELISVKQFIDRPTIVLPVYYSCTNVCSVLLGSLAGVLDNMQDLPGKDYKVLSISFDDRDTPQIALDKKKNYMASFNNPFPEEDWKFLTGDSRNIKAFTDSIGFRFKKRGDNFLHPSALIVLSSEGKIIRYLYGDSYLPFDLKMAIIEASEGRVGPTITKVLKYCFSYDPGGRRYVFNILRVSASLLLVFIAIFITWLVVTGNKRQGKT